MSYIHSFTHSTNSYRASTKFQVLVKYQWHLSEQDRQKSLCSWSLHPSGFRNVRLWELREREEKKLRMISRFWAWAMRRLDLPSAGFGGRIYFIICIHYLMIYLLIGWTTRNLLWKEKRTAMCFWKSWITLTSLSFSIFAGRLLKTHRALAQKTNAGARSWPRAFSSAPHLHFSWCFQLVFLFQWFWSQRVGVNADTSV